MTNPNPLMTSSGIAVSHQDFDAPSEYRNVSKIPTLYSSGGEQASTRYAEFFAAQIRNPNTRRAYLRAVNLFSDFCGAGNITALKNVQPLHVAAWVEVLCRSHSKPTVKQYLAGVRMLFDWLVTGQVIPSNPATSVRGPKYSIRKGKTPIVDGHEVRTLLDSIGAEGVVSLRDRALIGVMTYTFARVGAVVQIRVSDYFYQGHRAYLRLHEKGGKEHEMPVHHKLQDYLESYLHATKMRDRGDEYLFQSASGRGHSLTGRALSQSDVHAMVRRRAHAANIKGDICNHTFRATGITEYLKNGGTIEIAQRMAGHESARTTGLYDRRSDAIELNEVERIRL